jgi:3-phosphoshikimate 1-carboxyvinyltransferase
MNQHVLPGFIQGTLPVRPSKSYMQRACAAALIKGGKSVIGNYGSSMDDKAALETIRQLGAEVSLQKDCLHIESWFNRKPAKNPNAKDTLLLDLGESGLGLRMFTPIAALSAQPISITGHGSLLKRPMHFFDAVFPLLNVSVQTNNGYLPFTIKGAMEPANITIDGSLSSQFLTGVLMAYSAANATATITVNNLTSKPYIDITLDILKRFRLPVPVNNQYKSFSFTKTDKLNPEEIFYGIEGDWSGAAFLLAGAAINGDVKCTGLNLQSVQGDKKIMEALQLANAAVTIEADAIRVVKSKLTGFVFDATDCPDLFPPLVALAANAKGITKIKGLRRLLYKESNRGLTLQEEFAKLDIDILLQDDEMIIKGEGQPKVRNPNCDSHQDHRIAMALAVAILNATAPINIENAAAVSKSYPGFFDDIALLQRKNF